MEQKICIGKIVKTIGIKGEVKVIGYTDSLDRFKKLNVFYLDGVEFECENASIRKDFVALKIKNYYTPESAQKLKDKLIYVDRKDAVKLSKDQYFVCDLVGLKLVDSKSQEVGKILDIENYGASDILDCEINGKQCSVPFIENIFSEIDIERGYAILSARFYEVMV